jgi:DNA-binding LacI/PurR family transcriptional regulator
MTNVHTNSRPHQTPVMADVARLAGVSAITVSRVVNNDSAVTESTRAKVRLAINELGYRSNMAARTLAGGRSRVLGAISIETKFYGPSHTLFGIEKAARAAGHTVNFATVNDPSTDELRHAINRLRDAHVEGAIVLAPLHAVVTALSAIDPGVPLVVTSTAAGAAATVSINQTHGARLATAHLLDLGHQTVHHVRGPHGWLDADARFNGWRGALRARKRRVPPVLLGDWSPRSGYDAGRELATDPSVTGVFVANDHMALGVMLALHEAGRHVPGDVSVIGFDDTPESEFFIPPLTTVRQDFGEVGRRSVDLLLSLVAGEEPERISIAPTLVVRSSTAAPKQ